VHILVQADVRRLLIEVPLGLDEDQLATQMTRADARANR
jgi:hypothetical protein